MSTPVISVSNLGKKYVLHHKASATQKVRADHRTLRDALVNGAKSLFSRAPAEADGNGRDSQEEFWALRGVSFDVFKGDVVGVIGRNGAGKSTLLKILSRITEPTEGQVRIRGRLASLLEVGTGFHPELSGRENIFLNGSILGMSQAEIRSKFDEIVDFAEVERFLDTPVKHYSSGMYVRLAFAVAAHLEPEILVVDEVLAVGDVKFQRKCLGKMEAVGKTGRTIFFVSHNIALINNLCTKGIVLNAGRVVMMGGVNEAVDYYVGMTDTTAIAGEGTAITFDDPEFQLHKAFVHDKDGSEKGSFRTSEEICLSVAYTLKKPLHGFRFGIDLVNVGTGDVLFRTFDDDQGEVPREPGNYESTVRIPSNLLLPGLYALRFQVCVHKVRWIMGNSHAIRISVEHVDGVNDMYADHRPGVIMPRIAWELNSERSMAGKS